MIVDAVLKFFLGLVTTVLGWIPTSSAPNLSGAVASLSTVWQLWGWLNQYIGLSELVAYLTVMLVLMYGTTLLRAAVWVATKAHILGGSSD